MKLKKLALVAMLGAAVAAPFAAEAQGGKGSRDGFNAENTRGWDPMTAAERTEHQSKMLAAKTYDRCKAIQAEHHKVMDARANEKGMTLGGRSVNACDNMKARGLIG